MLLKNHNFKNKFLQVFFYSIGLAIFIFIIKILLDNWQKLKDYHFVISYPALFLAWLLAILSMLSLYFIWLYIFKKISPQIKISRWLALKIFIYSWFGKYAPGRVWGALGRVYLGSKEGLPKKPIFLSSVLELALFMLAQLLLTLFFLLFIFSRLFFTGHYLLILVIFLAGGIFILHPKVLTFLLNLALKMIKREAINKNCLLNYRDNLRIIFYYFLPILLIGFSFLLLAKTFIVVSWSDWPLVLGGFVIANTVSMLSFFLPAGLGAREGALLGLLGLFLSLPLAGLLAVASRILFVLTDLSALILFWLADKRQVFVRQAISKVAERHKRKAKG